MNWILLKDKKPDTDCLCFVTNIRGGWEGYLTIYQKNDDVFKLYDPKNRHNPCLEVTHWVKLPDPPNG